MGRFAELSESIKPFIDGALRAGYLLGLNHAGVSPAESRGLFQINFGDDPTPDELEYVRDHGVTWEGG